MIWEYLLELQIYLPLPSNPTAKTLFFIYTGIHTKCTNTHWNIIIIAKDYGKKTQEPINGDWLNKIQHIRKMAC